MEKAMNEGKLLCSFTVMYCQFESMYLWVHIHVVHVSPVCHGHAYPCTLYFGYKPGCESTSQQMIHGQQGAAAMQVSCISAPWGMPIAEQIQVLSNH